MRQFRELSRFLLYFFLGILIGTITANWMTGWLLGVPKFIQHYLSYRTTLASQAWEIRFMQTAPQRLVIPLVLWIAGRQEHAKRAFIVLTVLAGIWLGCFITWLTCMNGWRGIFVFLQLTFPQTIGYLPVWCVMAWGNWGGGHKPERREQLLLVGLYAAGLLSEVILNPLILKFLHILN